MIPPFLLAALLVAQVTGGAVGVGGGGVAVTTTTVPTTVVMRTTTSVLNTTTPPPTSPPPTSPPPTSPPPTSPPPTSPPPSAPAPAPTRPPTPRPVTPTSPRTTVAGAPSVEAPAATEPDSSPEAAPGPDPGGQASEAGPDVSSPPPPDGSPAPVMRMDKPSTEPGGVVVLTGTGCAPGAAVAVAVGDVAVGSIDGSDDGRFVAVLTLPDVGPGRYDIHVACGTNFTIPIDVVVATSVDSPNSVLALFIFFVLLALVLFRRRRIAHPPALRPAVEPEDDPGHGVS